MQNPTGNLRAQLQHSSMVMNGFVGDVQLLKSESKALSKSVNNLAKDYLKQCRRNGTAPEVASSRLAQLHALGNCSQSIYDQAFNLKVCLNALLNHSYKRDLKLAEQGKPTKGLRQVEQEAETFETHIRLVESLVATVLPQSDAPNCHKALIPEFGQAGNLEHAYNAVVGLNGTAQRAPLLGDFRVRSMKAAAIRLRDQIEAPGVRQRVGPMPPGAESSNPIL